MQGSSVFEKSYWQVRDPARCERRGRSPYDCAVSIIVKRLLAPVYGPDLEISRCESSTSLIIRPDPFFGVFRQRAARQAFIFEKHPMTGAGLSLVGSVDVRCPSKQERAKFQRSKRWREALWCGAGYLRPPSHMTVERGYNIPLLDSYSTHGGLLPFPCTPYVSHHGFFGYVCGQASVYLCLEMMLRYGASPHSPATINHILSKLTGTRDYDPVSLGRTCRKHRPGQNEALQRDERGQRAGFYNRPMYHQELESLFECEALGTKGLRISLGLWPDRDLAAVLHLKAMLQSQIPVIAVVDFDSLVHGLLSDFPRAGGWGHVVTIIGYVLDGPAFGVIFHDGHLGPYRELTLDRFLIAAAATRDEKGQSENAIVMYSPFPAGVAPKGYLHLFQEVYDVAESGTRCNMRLLRVEALRRYLLGYAPGLSGRINFRKLESLLGLKAEAYIWLVEYQYENGTYFDVVDTPGAIAHRLGVLACGVNTLRERWMFYPSKGDARRVELNPVRRKGMVDGAKGECIKEAIGR